MGTRNLTMVINKEGETKIAQYGQWDGYPEGQGRVILTFLNRRKSSGFKKFQKKLELVHFSTEEEEKEMQKFSESIGSKDGWMTMEQSAKYHERYPLLTRDLGGAILKSVDKLTKPTFLQDSTDFAGDGLFCEYAYVVDFKKGNFEVYEGFSKRKLTEKDRFYPLFGKSDNGYSPVVLRKTFKLNNLPTVKQFLKILEPKEE